jgi:hypothetical protein
METVNGNRMLALRSSFSAQRRAHAQAHEATERSQTSSIAAEEVKCNAEEQSRRHTIRWPSNHSFGRKLDVKVRRSHDVIVVDVFASASCESTAEKRVDCSQYEGGV